MVPISALFLRGVFSGFCGTPIQTLSVIDFDKGQIGAINTIFNACRQVSISFGVAISSGLMITGMSLAKLNEIYSISPGNIIKVFGPGFLAIPIIALAGIIIAQSLKKVFNISE
jgi:hypothetical protein